MRFLLGMTTGAFVSLITTTSPDQAIANWLKWGAAFGALPQWSIILLASLIGGVAMFSFGTPPRKDPTP